MDWQQASHTILQQLDLKAEYAALGVELAGNKPSAAGWVPCRVFGGNGDDRNPSAGINVAGEGPALGRYKEFTGEGRNLSFFEFAAAVAGRFADWKEARRHYAKQAGVKLPKGGPPETAAEKFTWRPGREHQIRVWCRTKPPIADWAAVASGMRVAGWPAATQQFTVVCLPVYGPDLTDADPTGFVFWNKTGRDLLLHQGKDREPKRQKMLMHGTAGWVGRHGLDRLADAEIVWKVEGPGDLLALLSAIPPDLREKHVVITNSNGSMQGLGEEFWDHLAGKTVYVVHDCDRDGQAGGEKQARLAAAIAAEVRHVTLPYEIAEKHGKDLRDFLGEGHVYQELIELAAAAPIVERPEGPPADAAGSDPDGNGKSTAPSPTIEQDREICESIGLDVLGERPNREIVVYAQGKTDTIQRIARLTHDDLLQIAGPVVRDRVHQSAEAVIPGQHRFSRVREAIAVLAGQERIRDQGTRGAGIWPGRRHLVLVGRHEAAVWNAQVARLDRVTRPRADGLMLDLDCGDEPWYEFDRLQADVERAADPAWRTAALDELVEVLKLWPWQTGPGTTTLLAGLTLATWVQTIWKWRPHVALTAESSAGKSTFLGAMKSLYGPLAMAVHKPSEAGLRQYIRNQACVILIDEIESDYNRRRLLELLRTSGTGARILRGTPGQGGIEFGLKHIAWIGAIEVGTDRQPDANRYLSFETNMPTAEAIRTFRPPAEDDLRDLGQRLLAIAVRCSEPAREMARELRSCPLDAPDGRPLDGRTVESLAVPAAMLAAAMGYEDQPDAARHVLEFCAGCIPQQSKPEPDQVELMHAILGSQVNLERGERATVAQLLARFTGFSDAESPEDLERVGIVIVVNQPGPREFASGRSGLFLDTKAIRRYLLADTPWASQSIDTILLRLPGAERGKRRIGSRRVWGVEIEWSSFASRFLNDEAGSSDQSF
mgnify:CR=1 FL=1